MRAAYQVQLAWWFVRRPVVQGAYVAVWHGEFDEPPTEGRRRVVALDPELVWLTHEQEPWRPHPV